MRCFTASGLILIVATCWLAVALASPRAQEAEYFDDEEEDAQPNAPTPPPARNPLSRSRAPVVSSLRKPSTKKATEQSTTATLLTSLAQSAESSEEIENDSSIATTTEAPKKYLIAGRGGVVRPFRSNDELLAALKRRRQNSGLPTHAPQSTTEQAPTSSSRQSKSQRLTNTNSNNKRGRFGSGRVTEAAQDVQDVTPAPSRAGRNNPPAFGRRPAARRTSSDESSPQVEEFDESPEEVPQRRFSPRRRS